MDDETAKLGLDEALLGDVLPRWAGGLSRPTFGIAPHMPSLTPKSPEERVRWLDELMALSRET